MSDDRAKGGAPDRGRINFGEDYEVRDWAAKFGVTEERRLSVVEKVGPMADDVKDEITRRK